VDDDFDSFFRRAAPRVVLFLIKLGASRQQAEDAAQEAMLRAYQAWSTIRYPEAWVRVVASRVHAAAVAGDRCVAGTVEANLSNLIAADTDLLVDDEERRRVLELLRRLPPAQRLVMAWYVDGFGPKEIAAILQKNPDTVRSDLRHARLRLRRELADALEAAREVGVQPPAGSELAVNPPHTAASKDTFPGGERHAANEAGPPVAPDVSVPGIGRLLREGLARRFRPHRRSASRPRSQADDPSATPEGSR
jgi:RNA polymerase sigma factor (sigma-70 family)